MFQVYSTVVRQSCTLPNWWPIFLFAKPDTPTLLPPAWMTAVASKLVSPISPYPTSYSLLYKALIGTLSQIAPLLHCFTLLKTQASIPIVFSVPCRLPQLCLSPALCSHLSWGFSLLLPLLGTCNFIPCSLLSPHRYHRPPTVRCSLHYLFKIVPLPTLYLCLAFPPQCITILIHYIFY